MADLATLKRQWRTLWHFDLCREARDVIRKANKDCYAKKEQEDGKEINNYTVFSHSHAGIFLLFRDGDGI